MTDQTSNTTLNVAAILTLVRDPATGDIYPAFLQGLDYMPDPDFGGWWK